MKIEKSNNAGTVFGFGGLVTISSVLIVNLCNKFLESDQALYTVVMTLNPLLSGSLGYLLLNVFTALKFRTANEIIEDRNFEREYTVMKNIYEKIENPDKKAEAKADMDDFCLARMRSKTK